MIPAIMVLEDGRCFSGFSYGAPGEAVGELVLDTSITGYQELLTTPAHYRQIVVSTTPHMGITGWNDEDNESGRIQAVGFVDRDPSRRASNWRSNRTLESELTRQGVVGISGVDTRALARHLHSRGTMRAVISTLTSDVAALQAKAQQAPSMVGASLIADVGTHEPYQVGESGPRIAVLDCGVARSTLHALSVSLGGAQLHVLPATTHPGGDYDGLFVSDGPGDPAAHPDVVEALKAWLATGIPVTAQGLGALLLARACGLETPAMERPHRGLSEPVRDRRDGRIEITSHNHGFTIDMPSDRAVESPFGTLQATHVAINDCTVEGFDCVADGVLRAQGRLTIPADWRGPLQRERVFARFADMISAERSK